jgi:hypothetical protein
VRRTVLLTMIPVNLLLLAWAWFGRLAFGVGGWFMLLLAPVVVVAGVALLVTSILALTQDGSPKALTGAQTGAQLLTWLGLLGFGLFLPDFGDTDDSARSVLTQLFGYSDDLYDAGFVVALAFGVLALVAYLVLLVLLIARRRAATPAY